MDGLKYKVQQSCWSFDDTKASPFVIFIACKIHYAPPIDIYVSFFVLHLNLREYNCYSNVVVAVTA